MTPAPGLTASALDAILYQVTGKRLAVLLARDRQHASRRGDMYAAQRIAKAQARRERRNARRMREAVLGGWGAR